MSKEEHLKSIGALILILVLSIPAFSFAVGAAMLSFIFGAFFMAGPALLHLSPIVIGCILYVRKRQKEIMYIAAAMLGIVFLGFVVNAARGVDPWRAYINNGWIGQYSSARELMPSAEEIDAEFYADTIEDNRVQNAKPL